MMRSLAGLFVTTRIHAIAKVDCMLRASAVQVIDAVCQIQGRGWIGRDVRIEVDIGDAAGLRIAIRLKAVSHAGIRWVGKGFAAQETTQNVVQRAGYREARCPVSKGIPAIEMESQMIALLIELSP